MVLPKNLDKGYEGEAKHSNILTFLESEPRPYKGRSKHPTDPKINLLFCDTEEPNFYPQLSQDS